MGALVGCSIVIPIALAGFVQPFLAVVPGIHGQDEQGHEDPENYEGTHKAPPSWSARNLAASSSAAVAASLRKKS